MPVYRLSDELIFPHPTLAEDTGLLAVGGDLQPERLLLAYRHGIFPWFEYGDDVYWFSPDPRAVLFPAELRVHKSMRSIYNGQKFTYTLDTAFERVMRACAEQPREGVRDSWISERFIEGYTALHRYGLAHSVEVWHPETEELVGGLYGVSLGRIFFGESMFSRASNASKAGFIMLVRALEQAGFWLIDCQAKTEHLTSLGAREIDRAEFLDWLLKNGYERTLAGQWAFDAAGRLEVRGER
jgi:leucyl/phenylalanyl-tRNA--protein transferase